MLFSLQYNPANSNPPGEYKLENNYNESLQVLMDTQDKNIKLKPFKIIIYHVLIRCDLTLFSLQFNPANSNPPGE